MNTPSKRLGRTLLVLFLCFSGPARQAFAVNVEGGSDAFAERQFSSNYPLKITAANASATREPGEPSHGGDAGGHSLWWGWIAPVSGQVTVTTAGSDFDTLLGVYAGNTLTNLTTIGSRDDGQSDERIVFHAFAGFVYSIAADGYAGKTGHVVINLSFIPSPLNDDFANRSRLSGSPLSVRTSNEAATKEIGEPRVIAGYDAGSSIWWSWTPPVTGMLKLTTEGTAYDALLSIWTGGTVSNLTSIAQQDRSPFENITVHVIGGAEYGIAIDGYQGRVGTTVLNLSFVASPLNDDFANRARLTGSDISLVASNVASSFEVGEPMHVGKSGGKSVWWTWTALGNGTVRISTVGSSFDTLLAVYTGETVTNLVPVISADGDPGETVSFDAKTGKSYEIAVDGYHGLEGEFPLRLAQSVSTPLSSSRFERDDEFWTVVSFPDMGPFTNIFGGPYLPNHISTNGNPGGHLSQTDPDGNTWFWNAPTKLLGDQSLAYGRILQFDLRQSAIDSQFTSADVILSGSGKTIVFTFTNHPGATWTTFRVPLLAEAGWRLENLEGSPPSESEFRSILQSLTALRIRGEYRTGGDVGNLDNVAYGSPVDPEPPRLQAVLEGVGILALSWPATATDFVLLESSSVGRTATWSPVGRTPGVESGRFVIRVTPQAKARFYQLQQP